MRIRLIFILICLFHVCNAQADRKKGIHLLQRIHNYAISIDTSKQTKHEYYSYVRTTIDVKRRNFLLPLVPTVYVIAHGRQRQYISESYNKIISRGYNDYSIQTLLRTTTIPRKKEPLTNLNKYLAPRLYEKTIIDNTLLSPFHPANFKFYQYRIIVAHSNTIHIRFIPKRYNTRLIKGDAEVDYITGRIIKCNFSGEYDMISFSSQLELGKKGIMSLLPRYGTTQFQFRFMANLITGSMTAYYNLNKPLTDSINNGDNFKQMSLLRPDSLSPTLKDLYQQQLKRQIQDSIEKARDSIPHNNWAKRIFWDIIGDNLLNHIKTNYGQNNNGYLRINPIFNPLYMGYDHQRGFTYKFTFKTNYQLSSNSELSAKLRGGYAFKQKQFYFRIPVFYYFNKYHNGYIKAEIGNGSHIRNMSVRRDIESQFANSLWTGLIDYDLLNEFRQTDARLTCNYDINKYFSFQAGFLYQRKDAIYKHAFKALQWEPTYISFSPTFELQYRPWGWRGPIFSVNYDRSFKNILRSNTAYERMEFNAEYIHRLNPLQSLQMRIGSGFYIHRHHKAYFLNYENFKENNIPGGWNDDWSGEFELLRSDNYNASNYYIRANFTYESPLLLLSWLPLVGHYMETERIYFSALDVRNAHPYLELGYGFTSRVVSVGFFVSNGKNNRSVGCKFGFELFRHW